MHTQASIVKANGAKSGKGASNKKASKSSVVVKAHR